MNWFKKMLLTPLSWLYGAGVYLRNKLFDWHLLTQHSFPVPVVVVGNICAGGTGKTPHVEYIVDMLSKTYKIGVVSRGYKRKTKGFVMASRRSSPLEIGDEPYQIFHKFEGKVSVAVCEDRVKGITELLRVDPDINLVVLDDAFQHRYVKPSVAIVITEFARPVFEDHLLPVGLLRESSQALHRADIVIVSKCPSTIKAVDFTIYDKNLDLFPYQYSFYSDFEYGCLKPVFPDDAPMIAPSLDWIGADDMALIVAGIGNPKPFVMHLRRYKMRVKINLFPDHHNFTKKNMALIEQRFKSLSGKNNYIITTEKDAVRMANCPYFPHDLKPYVYYLPIKVHILRDQARDFEDVLNKLINASI